MPPSTLRAAPSAVPRSPRGAEHAGSSRGGEEARTLRDAPGPRIARPLPPGRDLGDRPPARHPHGRVRRFVTRWGWRAYAIPILAVATVITLADLFLGGTTTARTDAGTAASDTPATAAPGPTGGPESTAPPAPAQGDADPTETASAPPESAGFVQQGAGTVTVVDGTSPVYGTGPLQRFVVEVEDGIGIDGAEFAAAVESTLGDPRSWGNGGRMSFQRVGPGEAAAGAFDFKVTLISPGNMEAYCPGVGTGGYTSCRYGDRAVINLARWETAVPDYQGDVATYRLYVVNHEVGHALGNGHQQCTGPGRPAPVMQQQTLGLDGCTKNAWPHP
ncbi:Protein of unknown function [Geodermatophilus sabuli]|uniref:DUF3152 domain-containing protein n=1 Tax=Geodermatophilus sabuli TaxID=1564158 RepID=A0A285EHR7_9ACTN|nr:Protein of unknown function [Geodermatophilus sabuli]